MIATALEPSADEFVISLPRTLSSPGILLSLQELGTIERVPSYPDLLVLHTSHKTVNPKILWEKIQRLLGKSGATVYPALHDANSELRLPLGTVSVHFNEPPTKKALNLLSKKYRIKLLSQNKHAPTQYTFTAIDPSTQYLPEVINKLQSTLDARAVWPDTLSQYKRSV